MQTCSYSITHGPRPAVFADITRDTQVGVALRPLHIICAPGVERLPGDLQRPLIREFYKRIQSAKDWDGHYAAQSWLSSEVETLERERLSVAFDDSEIRLRAERAADLCRRMVRLEVMQDHARSLGIEPPAPSEKRTRVGCAKRLQCPRWWRRHLRKAYTRRAETHLRALGLVQKKKQVYASDRAVSWRRQRKLRDRAMLQEMEVVSDAGDQLNLFEVVEKSQANPALRRAELMTRLAGFEECSKQAGHVALFVTLTTPSAFHRTLSSGTANPLFQGFSPRDGQAWLSKMWARSRAKFKRLSLVIYGFRIAEPHHDGTPHWHMVLFGRDVDIAQVQIVLGAVWLSEFSAEVGAREHRAKFQPIRPEAGSATGYLAKYVSKNIDGFQVGEDFETEKLEASESCDRVAAWASAHGIRQFQQVGGPSVTVWRELRRVRSEVRDFPAIEGARAAADKGDWSAFIASTGGIERGRHGDVALWKETTGELSQYDELKAPAIAGVCCAGRRVRTRDKVWRVQKKRPTTLPEQKCANTLAQTPAERCSSAVPSGSDLGPVSITVRSDVSVSGHGCDGVAAYFIERGFPPWIN